MLQKKQVNINKSQNCKQILKDGYSEKEGKSY